MIGIFPEVNFLFQGASKSSQFFSSSSNSPLSGFSFLCLIRTFYKKSNIQESYTQRQLMRLKQNQTTQYWNRNKKLMANIYHKNQIKKVFLSAFQFPVVQYY